jgi:hypothetical protein
MPSTYTLNNGIELIGTGEQSGTWGDTTNTNLGLLDAALDGQVTITLAAAGSSGSPNALPITDGTTSNGRNRMVVFSDSGDLGATAYVQLTPNDAEKIIYIRNSLSGSRSVILFQGTYNASNDYEVPAGTTAIVYFDGAGAGAVAANVFNNAYFDGLRLGSVSVTAILDEDNMASDSATALATQQSIKAYVDSQVGTVDTLAEILAIGNTTGGTDIVASTTDKVQFRDAAIYINSSVDGQLDIVADTEIQIAATTVDVNGALDVSGTALVTGVLTTTAATVFNGGFASNAASTITTADNTAQLTLISTDADASSGPQMTLYRNSSSPADNDFIGRVKMIGRNDNSQDFVGVDMIGRIIDASDGTEDSEFRLATIRNGTESTDFKITPTEVVFNEDGADVDFRVESDTNANALIVDGATGNIGFSLASTPYGSATTEGLFYTAGAGFDIASNTNTLRVNRNSTGGNDRVNIELQNNGTTRAEVGSLGAENGFYLSDSTKVIISGYSDEVVINETGADMDFRVESDTITHALFVQGSDGLVGIGTSSPSGKLTLKAGDNSYAGGFRLEGTDETTALAITHVNGNNYFSGNATDDHLVLTGAGNVGIGTTSPNRLLSLYATQPVFQITNVASGNTQGTIQYQVSGSTQFNIDNQGSGSGGVITFMQAGSERMRIDSSGGLITTPAAGGHAVFNESSVDADFRVESDGNANMLFVDAGANYVGIGSATNYSAKLTVEGTKTRTNGVPYYQLSVVDDTAMAAGTGGAINFWGKYNNAGDKVEGASIEAYKSNGTSANYQYGMWLKTRTHGGNMDDRLFMDQVQTVFNETGADTDFRVESDSNANALFVQASDGKVGIGTSSPETNNAASVGLTVGSGGGGAAIQLNVNGGGGIFSGTDTINNPNYSYRMGHLNGTNRLEMSTNNNDSYANGVVLSAGGTSWGTFSDERRKTDLVEITDGLNKVSTLRAVTGRYNYDDANVRRSMLIAQDVQAVLPEAVGAMTASMEDPTEYLTLNYTETIPLLVSALKDAKQLIEALTARITALENA